MVLRAWPFMPGYQEDDYQPAAGDQFYEEPMDGYYYQQTDPGWEEFQE
jgi:hypothetical protein